MSYLGSRIGDAAAAAAGIWSIRGPPRGATKMDTAARLAFVPQID